MSEIKYEQKEMQVPAIYSDEPTGNPFLEAMPLMLSKEELFENIKSVPPDFNGQAEGLTSEKRLSRLTDLSTFFQPVDYMYMLYTQLYRAIQTTYTNHTMIAGAQRICAIRNKESSNQPWTTQPENGAILGVPGIGKTSTIRRLLNQLPQVIGHEKYQGNPFYNKQILWLCVECPSDSSVKTLAYSIIHAIDLAVGSLNLERIKNLYAISASALAMQVKVLCLTYHVGLIVIDEIQNVVTTAALSGQTKPLIRFLLELTNECATAVWFIGTPMAENIFLAQDHLQRRTRGLRLLPLRPDGTYRKFLEELWQYQYTAGKASLDDSIANAFYDRSGGIPAYLVQLFKETQSYAILKGHSCITKRVLNETAQLLAIPIPRNYSKEGTSISDIIVAIGETAQVAPISQQKHITSLKKFSNVRGRKPVEREKADLLHLLKEGGSMLELMQELNIVEVLP